MLTEKELLRRGSMYYECPCEDLIVGKRYLIEVLSESEPKKVLVLVGTFDKVYNNFGYAKDRVDNTHKYNMKMSASDRNAFIGIDGYTFSDIVDTKYEHIKTKKEPPYYGTFVSVKKINITETRKNEGNKNKIITEDYTEPYNDKLDEHKKTRIMFTANRSGTSEEFNVKGFKFYEYDYSNVLFLTSETMIDHVLDNKLPIEDEYFSKDLAERIRSLLDNSLKPKRGGEKKKRNLKSRKTKNRNRRTLKLVNK